MTDPTLTPLPPDSAQPVPSGYADQLDERLRVVETGVAGSVRGFVDRVRSGDLGSLPVIVGLVVIAAIFQTLNSVFLSTRNLVNLVIEMSPVGVLALGVVAVLLVGQIDLSVGSVSGLSAAVMAIMFVDLGWPALGAIVAAVLMGTLIGWTYAQLYNRFGVPSFVATLAGLLAFEGLQYYLLGANDAITLGFGSGIVKFASVDFLPDWLSYLLVALAAVGFFASRSLSARARRRANLSATSPRIILAQAALLLLSLGVVTWYLNRGRGVGYVVVLFIGLTLVVHYALTRTLWDIPSSLWVGTSKQPGELASTSGPSTPRASCCARRWPLPVACWRLRGWPRRTRPPAAATSTSTRSLPPSSVEPACSEAAGPPSRHCWVSW